MARRSKPEWVKLFKLDTTHLSDLQNLSIGDLQDLLKEWSRIGNQRAKRMKRIDKDYSGLYEYEKSGKFGKFNYNEKEKIINELKRIQRIGSKLKASKVKKEQDDIKKAKERIEQKAKNEGREGTIPLDKFRKAFAIFRAGYGVVPPEVYDKVKAIVLTMTDRPLDEVVSLIARLVEEEMEKYYANMRDMYEPDEFEDEEDLPW